MLSTHSGICLFSLRRRNQHKSNKRDFPSSSQTNPRLLYIIIAHFLRSSSSTMTSSRCLCHLHHHNPHGHHLDHHHQLVVAITGGVERKGERQSGVRRLNKMMQKLTSECKKGNCFLHIFRVKREIIKRGIPKRKNCVHSFWAGRAALCFI